METAGTQLEMVSLATPQDWAAFHEIRRTVLFEGRGRMGVYDENHPDDRAPGNHPFLLLADGTAVAAVRVDLFPDANRAVFRRLAVRAPLQRQGYGRALMARAEKFARDQGCRHFVAHVAPDAIAFWERLGYCVTADQAAGTDPRMEKYITG
jgi:GNAT superfamily N-acetyltransferase